MLFQPQSTILCHINHYQPLTTDSWWVVVNYVVKLLNKHFLIFLVFCNFNFYLGFLTCLVYIASYRGYMEKHLSSYLHALHRYYIITTYETCCSYICKWYLLYYCTKIHTITIYNMSIISYNTDYNLYNIDYNQYIWPLELTYHYNHYRATITTSVTTTQPVS